MKNLLKKSLLIAGFVLSSTFGFGQTNVYDDVIATSPDHTSLTLAIQAAELEGALQDASASLTVFAPDNDAFDDLAAALGLSIPELLDLDNLSDILLYHVLGEEVLAAAINNGDIVTPLNTANTIKLTVTSDEAVFANQAQVNAPDLVADNGVVHSLDAVILSDETVVDVAIDNSFTSLTAAVVAAELLPVLTDPLAEFTVFAPSNAAFDALADALGTDIDGLLADPDLANILTYHVLSSEVMSSMIGNGDIVTPVNDANTIKLTVTSDDNVFANQALVEIADLDVDNGVVHAIDAVILSSETVADVAIDNGFSTLAAAVTTAELLPALTDPFAELTVFAPTNEAFDDLAVALGTDLDGLLALPNLSDSLLYHVVGETLLAADLENGEITMLNGENALIDLSMGVAINNAMVDGPDNTADNGVVHIIDAVLDQNFLSIDDLEGVEIALYPNPAVDFVRIENFERGTFSVFDITGAMVKQGVVNGTREISLSDLETGVYIINLLNEEEMASSRFVKM
ncbi:MAG: fasciclin domain-containing protein [Cryomorphaceae bacterium]